MDWIAIAECSSIRLCVASTASRLAFAALLLSFAVAANAADSVKAARALIASNSVDRTSRCRYYKAWYVEQCTEAERAEILERNVEGHRRWLALEPGSPFARSDLGLAYASAGMWDKAKPELAAAIAAGNRLDSKRRAEARWEMSNCLWNEGDKAGARKLIAELAAMEGAERAPVICRMAQFLHRAWTDPDGEMDVFNLPHSVDGRPFPVPQQEEYGTSRLSLAKVELKVKGLKGEKFKSLEGEDPIVRLLKRKLGRFGTKFEKGGTKVVLELSEDAPVDKPLPAVGSVYQGVPHLPATPQRSMWLRPPSAGSPLSSMSAKV